MAEAPADWYPDPLGEGAQRYWDGVGWTGYVRAWRIPNRHVHRAKIGLIVAGIAAVLAFGTFASAVDPGPGETQASYDQLFITFGVILCIAALFAAVESIIGVSQRRAAQGDDEARATSPLAPPGWYRDPEHPDRARYWTGVGWSDSRDAYRDAAGSGPGVSSPPPPGSPRTPGTPRMPAARRPLRYRRP